MKPNDTTLAGVDLTLQATVARKIGVNPGAQSESEQNVDTMLDAVKIHLHIKNDAGLAARLQVAPPIISKLRHRRIEMPADLYISIHEETDISIRNLRSMAGDTRKHLGRYGQGRKSRAREAN